MEIQEIKGSLSILKVLEHYGLHPDKNGMLKCPFHNDKTPSMLIYPKSNTYCCFSSNCTAGTGDQIQFIELKEKTTKHQALLLAKQMLGVGGGTPPIKATVSTSVPKELPTEPTTEPQDYDRLFSKLKQNVSKSQKAKEYIESRNLQLDKLEIGYNANTFEHLKDCIVFPLKDKNNRVVSLYGRGINKGHYYTANRKGLYPGYPSSDTRTLILTESVIDAGTLLQNREIATQYSILALYGTNGLTEEHMEAMSELKHLQEIIIWMDGDEAGTKATDKYKTELYELFNRAL